MSTRIKCDFGQCDTLPFTNATGGDLAMDDVIVHRQKLGIVTQKDVPDGEDGLLIVAVPAPGANLPKAAGFAAVAGDPAYWDIADGNLNSDSVNNDVVGHYYQAAASADTVARVVLTNEQRIA